MSKVNWLITDSNVTVNYNGQTHIVSRKDKLSDRLIDAVKNNKLDEIPALVSASKRIEIFSEGNFTVRDGKVFVGGVEAPQVLSNKIIRFSGDGLPFQPLVKFAERLQKNPSFRAVQELFGFLEKNDHPITENGCFIAYKRVRDTFKDIYSNTMDNSVGTVVEMPRNQVNEDAEQTCSHGLHVANWDYAHTHYSSSDPETDVMLEVEVDPADVVAIPVDYNNSKMRVCKYKVLGVVDSEHSTEVQLRVVDSLTSSSNDDFLFEDETEEDEDKFDDESSEEEIYDDESSEESSEEEVYDDVSEEEDESSEEDDYPWEDELV